MCIRDRGGGKAGTRRGRQYHEGHQWPWWVPKTSVGPQGLGKSLEGSRKIHTQREFVYSVYLVGYGEKRKGGRGKGGRRESGGGEEKEQKLPLQERDRKRERAQAGGGRRSACLSRSGWSLSIKGAAYLGDRPGQ